MNGLPLYLLILFITILFSFFIERYVKPVAPRITTQNSLLQSLVISLAFFILTLVIQRPFFSGITIMVFLGIVVIVSNTKYRTLKEPMVFSDFTMFSQAFKHPRLYFPFLGLAPLILGPLIIIGLVVLVLSLEPAMPLGWQRLLATLVGILITFYLTNILSKKLTLSLLPEKDIADFGLTNSLVAYALQARQQSHQSALEKVLLSSPFNKQPGNNRPNKNNSSPPNITVIQSESFFDARRLHPAIRNNILKTFQQCQLESLTFGKLQVPAWGANTMRSEFAFLSGLASNRLGLYQFYPYQFLNNMPLYTLASALKKRGYHCVCIHPHPASFFGRDKVFPQMGFDEFIDDSQFEPHNTFGPYISDQAVTDKILDITKQKTDKPLFIFAITMENHGPLHLESVSKEEYTDYLGQDIRGQLENADDLVVYLRHLKNADKMISDLTTAYRKAKQETKLCFYGDHVPSMPQTYRHVDYTDKHSDYFIWSSQTSTSLATDKQNDMDIENLAACLL